jgi:hypothetical protein
MKSTAPACNAARGHGFFQKLDATAGAEPIVDEIGVEFSRHHAAKRVIVRRRPGNREAVIRGVREQRAKQNVFVLIVVDEEDAHPSRIAGH